jgi:hypothetical protein
MRSCLGDVFAKRVVYLRKKWVDWNLTSLEAPYRKSLLDTVNILEKQRSHLAAT